MKNLNTNPDFLEDDENEFLNQEEEIQEPSSNTAPEGKPDNAELERLKAENEALRLASTIRDEVITKPISLVDKYMKDLNLTSKEELNEYLPILEEADRSAQEAYEAKVKLAELSRNPVIRKAQLENDALIELRDRGNEWESEFFEVYEHTDKIKSLDDNQKKELITFLGTKLKETLVERKLANKTSINPMLLIQKDITKKLKAITKTEEATTKKPASFVGVDPKNLMSLNSAAKPNITNKQVVSNYTPKLSNSLMSLFEIED